LRAATCGAVGLKDLLALEDDTKSALAAAPQRGFTSHEAYENSQFYSTCHQFPQAGFRMNGVLLQNTWAKWLQWNVEREPAD
jgi:hypothetical protein